MRNSISDLLAITVLRSFENSDPSFDPAVDLPLSTRWQSRSGEESTAANELLGERADKLLNRRYGFGKRELASAVRWLRYGRWTLLTCVVVSAIGICGRLLLVRDDTATVSLEGFALFLGLNMVMAVPPILLMLAQLASVWPRQSGGHMHSSVLELLADIGKAFSLTYYVLKAVTDQIQKRLFPSLTYNLANAADAGRTSLEHVTRSLSQLALRQLALTSHLCWVLVCGVTLICFLGSTIFRDYDFRWRSTWLDEARKLRCLQSVTVPIRPLPVTPAPDERLVSYLSIPDSPGAPAGTEPYRLGTTQRDEMRRTAVDLLAALLLYYGLLPRLVLLGLAWVQLGAGLRHLQPSLDSTYFRTIRGYWEKPPMGPAPDTARPEPPPDRSATPVPTPALPAGDPGSRIPVSAREPATLATTGIVFSYEVQPPTDGWTGALDLGTFGEVRDLGNVCDAQSRSRVRDDFAAMALSISSVTIVVDLVSTPDAFLARFLTDLFSRLSTDALARSAVLLTGGERLRLKYRGDPDRIHTRISLWHAQVSQCGISGRHIVQFDHELSTHESRRALSERLHFIRRDGAGNRTGDAPQLRRAGRFAQACRLILGGVEKLARDTDPAHIRTTAVEIHQRLRDLYQREAGLFDKGCEILAHSSSPLSRVPDGVAIPSEYRAVFTKLTGVVEFYERLAARVRRYEGGLSLFWGAGFATAAAVTAGCLALAGGVATATIAVPAVVISAAVAGTLGCHVPHMAAKLRSFLAPSAACAAEDGATACEPLGLDEVLRSAAIAALVLELQGNAEDDIAATLNRLLIDCCEDRVASVEDARHLLHELESRLTLVAGRAAGSEHALEA